MHLLWRSIGSSSLRAKRTHRLVEVAGYVDPGVFAIFLVEPTYLNGLLECQDVGTFVCPADSQRWLVLVVAAGTSMVGTQNRAGLSIPVQPVYSSE